LMISKRYTMSLGEQSTLRKDLESWRGKKFTPEELQGFDLNACIDFIFEKAPEYAFFRGSRQRCGIS